MRRTQTSTDPDDPSETELKQYYDEQYMENVEEMRAINGLEKLIRESLGKSDIRTSHSPSSYSVGYTDDITSSKPEEAPTQEIESKINSTNEEKGCED